MTRSDIYATSSNHSGEGSKAWREELMGRARILHTLLVVVERLLRDGDDLHTRYSSPLTTRDGGDRCLATKPKNHTMRSESMTHGGEIC